MKIYIEEHLYNISEAKTNMCIAEEDWGSVYVFAILQSSPRQTESQGKDKILSGGVTPFLTLYIWVSRQSGVEFIQKYVWKKRGNVSFSLELSGIIILLIK